MWLGAFVVWSPQRQNYNEDLEKVQLRYFIAYTSYRAQSKKIAFQSVTYRRHRADVTEASNINLKVFYKQ